MKTPDDKHLIELFGQDAHTGFKRIVEEYQDKVFNLCVHMLHRREDAQDAAQDTFIKAFRGLKDFRPQASLYTWLYRIAINTCTDYRRRHRTDFVEGDDLITEIASTDPSPEKVSQSREATAFIHKALESLTPDFRAVIVLKEIEGFSYTEIADVMNTSVGTVKSRLSRARDDLRKVLRNKV